MSAFADPELQRPVRQLMLLKRRLCLAATTLILIVAAGLGYDILRTAPAYAENATVLFALPTYETTANAYSWLAPALITTGDTIAQIVMNPQSADQIRAAGGAGQYDLELINSYNQDYPDFNFPDAAISASSPDAAETRWTFEVTARLMRQILAQRQELAGVPAGDRITARIIADSGVVAQSGARKRALAGLALLTLIAGCAAWRSISRWNPA
jgi:hypothetical protein